MAGVGSQSGPWAFPYTVFPNRGRLAPQMPKEPPLKVVLSG